MFRHSLAASLDKDYGYISDIRQTEKRRALQGQQPQPAHQEGGAGGGGGGAGGGGEEGGGNIEKKEYTLLWSLRLGYL